MRVIRVQPPVERLYLILPLEKQLESVVVKKHEFYVECSVNGEHLQ